MPGPGWRDAQLLIAELSQDRFRSEDLLEAVIISGLGDLCLRGDQLHDNSFDFEIFPGDLLLKGNDHVRELDEIIA